MSNTVILIDSHALGYASQMMPKLTVGTRPVQAIFGFVKKLRHLQSEYKNARIITLWDGHAQWRYDLYPAYKGKRDQNKMIRDMRAGFRDQKKDIKRACALLGVGSVYDPGLEADDLAGVLSRRLIKNGSHVILVTGDRDWIQLVRPECSWMNIRDDNIKHVHHTTFLDMTGYATPQGFLQGKALQGDGSDNIHPVGKLGEKTAAEFMAEYGSVPKFVASYRAGKYDGVKLKKAYRDLAENAPCPKHEEVGRLDVFKRNMALMNLQTDPAGMKLQTTNPNPDFDAFGMFCRELNFTSILNQFDQWVAPFKR